MIAETWPIVDEITARHGVVTAALVPAYRERAGEVEHGRLTVRSAQDVAELYRTHATHRFPACRPWPSEPPPSR